MYRELETITLGTGEHCPVCNSACYKKHGYPSFETLYMCPVCGKFVVNSMAELFLNGLQQERANQRHKISYHLRSISERAYGTNDKSFFPTYASEEFERMAEANEPSVTDKLNMLLQFIAGRSDYPGHRACLDLTSDYSVICARNEDELFFFQQSLESQGLITAELTSTTNDCILTAAGWSQIENLLRTGGDSSSGFIAMWFDPTQDPARATIRRAIEGSGYLPIRIDEVEHVNRIDDEIIAKIRQSKFLVADFTGQRNGVYFEAGFMLGLGRPVIWVCHENEIGNVHFDTRQYNTIVYTDLAELQSKLQFRIEAILGKGPHKST